VVSCPRRILLIEDDRDVIAAIELALAPGAASVLAIAHPDALAEAMASAPFDAALIDMNFAPGQHDGRVGLATLEAIRAADAALSVVTMTVYGGVALAVEALKRGACDFVLKPWTNRRLIEALVAAADLTAARRADASLNLEAIERHAIARALARHAGNISQAAAALGLTRPALYRRIEKHDL
jgi:two-component system response regulator RegA